MTAEKHQYYLKHEETKVKGIPFEQYGLAFYEEGDNGFSGFLQGNLLSIINELVIKYDEMLDKYYPDKKSCDENVVNSYQLAFANKLQASLDKLLGVIMEKEGSAFDLEDKDMGTLSFHFKYMADIISKEIKETGMIPVDIKECYFSKESIQATAQFLTSAVVKKINAELKERNKPGPLGLPNSRPKSMGIGLATIKEDGSFRGLKVTDTKLETKVSEVSIAPALEDKDKANQQGCCVLM